MPIWIKFRLINLPYYDPRTGNILESIEGRQNRTGIDPIAGGGKVYPDIDPALILKRKEKAGELLLKLDITPEEAAAMIGDENLKKYKASPKVTKEYKDKKDFKGEIVPDEIADPVVVVESGVTVPK